MDDIICGICYEECNNNIIWLVCAHVFCFNCIDRSLKIKNECPICRTINDEESTLKYIKDLSLKEYQNIKDHNNEILTFGKYKYKTFLWVYENNMDYCLWCIDNYDENKNINTNFSLFVNYIKQKKS